MPRNSGRRDGLDKGRVYADGRFELRLAEPLDFKEAR